MSETTIIAGQVLTPEGFVAARLRCTAAIRAIEPARDAPDDRYVLPGFIDLHVHGGAGADCMAGADAVRRMAAFHAGHGTTALLATTGRWADVRDHPDLAGRPRFTTARLAR